MSRQQTNSNISERTLMVVLLVLVILLSPVSNIWAALDAPWYSPYLAWAVTILLSWLLQRHLKRPQDNK
ncbi:MAG: UTP--glucose-1-phosphate uridylyltransferase [Gammaproteobacteria bacterium]|nr:UTP--glucose-1-phosphate uridylyltransferase [Gammaproteobacteria bacterium]